MFMDHSHTAIVLLFIQLYNRTLKFDIMTLSTASGAMRLMDSCETALWVTVDNIWTCGGTGWHLLFSHFYSKKFNYVAGVQLD